MPVDRRTDSPDGSLDWELAGRYLAGECNLEESTRFEAWLHADPSHGDVLDGLREIWGSRPPQANIQWDVAGIDRAVRARIAASAAVARRATRSGQRVPRRVVPQWRAAVVVIVAAVALGVVLRIERVPSGTASAIGDIVTRPSERVALTLADGTRLIVGPATRLRIPRDFGRTARTVELDGEAHFAVAHDASHPFAVRTGHAIVRDVGTTFAIRAYGDDADERVAVEDGEVALGPANLRANDVASIDTDGSISVQRGVDLAPYVGWSQGRLVFRDTPLPEVVRELGRTFDLTIIVSDSALARRHVTASYTDQPVDVILDDITAIIGAQYERAGRSIVIRRQTERWPGAGSPGASPRPAVSTALAREPGQ